MKKFKQQKYKGELDALQHANERIRGNMTKTEKQMNKASLKAYKNQT